MWINILGSEIPSNKIEISLHNILFLPHAGILLAFLYNKNLNSPITCKTKITDDVKNFNSLHNIIDKQTFLFENVFLLL